MMIGQGIAMTVDRRIAAGGLAVILTAAACRGESSRRGDTTVGGSAPQPGVAGTGSASATPPGGTGKVIEVKMMTDDRGNTRFAPNRIDANAGDVLRYTLVSGVHNAHFLRDSNAGKSNLPRPSDLLQLAGQTTDVALNFGTGTFFFQCDPHAALGMTGRVTVK
jgi:plastocyanin